jgi:poly(hydroxyalkanoate) granule-associated protein
VVGYDVNAKGNAQMVKKLQKLAEKKSAGSSALGGVSALLDSELANTVRESAHQIWLAGLGAFTKAQGEGSKAFDSLVKQGAAMHRKTQAVAEEKIGEVASRMTQVAGDVGAKAGQHWDKLETIFEERVAKALSKLGVPSSKDVHALVARIDALSATVARLHDGASANGTAAAPTGKAPRKATAKTAASKAGTARAPAAASADEAPAKPAAKRRPR